MSLHFCPRPFADVAATAERRGVNGGQNVTAKCENHVRKNQNAGGICPRQQARDFELSSVNGARVGTERMNFDPYVGTPQDWTEMGGGEQRAESGEPEGIAEFGLRIAE